MEGFEGLAAAILLAMACMFVVPTLFFGGIGWFAFRKKYGWVGGLAGALLGVAVGAGAVAATFYEKEITQKTLVLEVPAGFSHEWVVLIEDPSVSQEITWSGRLAPSGRLAVPSSGVVRVRSLTGVVGEDVVASLGEGGLTNFGMISRPAPPTLTGTHLLAYGFASHGTEREPDLTQLTESELTSRLSELEAL